jgi:regulator of replication initiation timing
MSEALGAAAVANLEQMIGQALVDIGELKGSVKAVISQNERAEVSRNQLYRETNDIKIAMGGMIRDQAELKVGVSLIKENVSSLETRLSALEIAKKVLNSRFEGGKTVVGWAWAVVVVSTLGVAWLWVNVIAPYLSWKPAK